eukprot:comp21462_c0_seq1/m.29679 comp21462_c0_seq1/g.29679  ORF comp21462_c0_seq1/g.29679 comp21462_c0_seq1/m.29679 type:complete len:467 (-) comp21462_c0_seq1:978-2378(-)
MIMNWSALYWHKRYQEEGQRLFFHCHMADQRSSNCRRMRASLKQLAEHNTQGPMILFWASPDEEVSSPQCTELSLHSRVDTTLAGSIPPYEIFSLHDVDTTFLHLCSGNLSGNRLGVPPTNPAFYNGFQQLHPMDAQALLYFVRDNIAETRSHRFWARSLTGHNTWTTLELLAKPCINRNTNRIEYIINKAIVEDELGTTYEPPPSPNPNEPLGVNPVYFDSVTELTSLIENLARESRQYFFRRHFERIQAAEEESIIAELQRYKDARKHPSHNSSPPTNPTPPVLPTQPMLQSTNAPSPQSLPNTSAYTPLLPSLLMPSLQFGSGPLSSPVASPANALSHTSHNRNISLALGMLKTANPPNPISTPTSNSNSGPPSGIQSMMSAGGAPANSTAGIQPIMSAGNMPPMLPMLTTPVMPMLGFTSDVMVPPVFPQNASQLGMQLQSVSDLQIEDMIERGDVNFQMQM